MQITITLQIFENNNRLISYAIHGSNPRSKQVKFPQRATGNSRKEFIRIIPKRVTDQVIAV